MGSEKIQEHEPCPNESFLVNAGEETSQILIDKDQVCVDRALNVGCLGGYRHLRLLRLNDLDRPLE